MAPGKVIKGDTLNEPTASGEREISVARGRRPILDGEVFDAHQQAQAIIEAANRKAAEIVAEAQGEREKVLDEAREEGRQEGLTEVTREWAENHRLRGEMLAKAEGEIVQLALKVAEKILGRDLERDPQLIVELCAKAIENVRNAKQLVLRLNPKDAAILREKRKGLMDLLGRMTDIGIREDPDVALHGVVIETDSGVVDAQLSTQLEMLKNLLLPLSRGEHRQEQP